MEFFNYKQRFKYLSFLLKERRVRYGADGGYILLRNLAPLSKQGVENYYGENRILATETVLPSYRY